MKELSDEELEKLSLKQLQYIVGMGCKGEYRKRVMDILWKRRIEQDNFKKKVQP